jgi:hypothetical protein
MATEVMSVSSKSAIMETPSIPCTDQSELVAVPTAATAPVGSSVLPSQVNAKPFPVAMTRECADRLRILPTDLPARSPVSLAFAKMVFASRSPHSKRRAPPRDVPLAVPLAAIKLFAGCIPRVPHHLCLYKDQLSSSCPLSFPFLFLLSSLLLLVEVM